MGPEKSSDYPAPRGRASPALVLNPTLFSRLDGKVIRTLVTTRGAGRIALPGSLRLQVSDSQHVMVSRTRPIQSRPASTAASRRMLHLLVRTGPANCPKECR